MYDTGSKGVVNNYTSSLRAKAYFSVSNEYNQKGGILSCEVGESETRTTLMRVRYSAKKIRVGTSHSTLNI